MSTAAAGAMSISALVLVGSAGAEGHLLWNLGNFCGGLYAAEMKPPRQTAVP
jgi:hypothetical protein